MGSGRRMEPTRLTVLASKTRSGGALVSVVLALAMAAIFLALGVAGVSATTGSTGGTGAPGNSAASMSPSTVNAAATASVSFEAPVNMAPNAQIQIDFAPAFGVGTVQVVGLTGATWSTSAETVTITLGSAISASSLVSFTIKP